MKYFPQKLTFKWLKSNYQSMEITPQEVAEEIVKRAAKYENKNIWIIPPSLELMKKYIDALPEYTEDMPLWGIPFAIKDNIDLEQIPTTAGCKEYEYIPEKSAVVVGKLIKAGAIPVGKTNLDQFATGLVGMRSPYGETHNAYNPELISGGSSSGSAVCVALGIAAFSLGTDTAGSGRVPAALNNLIGYKPPVGAWSSTGVVPACASLDCVTVFANCLEDAQKVNVSARGFDKTCCWSKEFPVPDYKSPEKIYVTKGEMRFYGQFANIYKMKWKRAVERLKNLGIKIEYIDEDIFQKAASILYDGPWVAERWKDLGGFIRNNPGKTFPVTEKILRSGENPEYTAAAVFASMHELQECRAKVNMLLKDAVLVMPTAGGTFTRDEVREEPIKTNSRMGLYTNHCNLLDLSAIAIPEKQNDDHIPFGITVFALAGAENLALGMANAFLESETTMIAVCGLHKKGYPLESQLTELGAVYVESTRTAPQYKLYQLNAAPVKPGLVRAEENGTEIEIDLYKIPIGKFGYFMKQVCSPLYIGDVELEEGNFVKGFLCEPYALKDAIDISEKKRFVWET